MTLSNRFPYPRLQAAALIGSTALALAVLARAQQAAPAAPDAPTAAVSADAFPFEIGHVEKFGAVYAVEATQPAASKLTGQKVRLKTVEILGTSKTTHYFSFATGKYKTVAQIDAVLSEIFRRFLSSPAPAAPGQELGRIGDVQHGGEVRFVAEPSNQLRLDNVAPGQPVRATYFSRADVEGLQAALTGAPRT